MSAHIARHPFGRLPDGRDVEAFTLGAPNGVSVRILTLGGVIQSVVTPDRGGRLADITLGFDAVADYLESPAHLGGLIGRVAGRLAGARTEIDGRVYELDRNDGENTLHGGAEGFDRAVWRVDAAGVESGAAVLRLSHHSPDGDQGFPGALSVQAVYALDAEGRLTLELEARADAPTRISMTSHPYWNLSGGPGATDDHWLQLAADEAFVMGPDLLPATSPTSVAGGDLDLRAPRRLGDLKASSDPAVRVVGGLDHVFVLNGGSPAARLTHPVSGRSLTVGSVAPAIVAYGGGGLAGGPVGKGGRVYGAREGVALEPQERPDRPVTLRPGEVWRWRQVLTFAADA